MVNSRSQALSRVNAGGISFEYIAKRKAAMKSLSQFYRWNDFQHSGIDTGQSCVRASGRAYCQFCQECENLGVNAEDMKNAAQNALTGHAASTFYDHVETKDRRRQP